MKIAGMILLAFILFNQAIGQEKDLSFFIKQAQQNSPLLKDYQNQIKSAQLDIQRLKAQYKPQVNGASVNSYAPVIHGYGYDVALSNGSQVSAIVAASKELNGFKNLKNQLQGIDLQNQGRRNTVKITEQDLKKSITAQYITTYSDWAQYDFNNEMLSVLKEEDIILKKLAQTGTYKQTDYLTFLVTLKQQELLIKQLKAQYANNYALLNYLSGVIDTAFVPLPDPHLMIEHLPGLENTVFYQQFILDSLMLRNADIAINLAYRPKVNIYVDGGYNSTLTIDPYKNMGMSAGLSVALPIYDGKQRKMQHDKVAISEETRKNYQQFFTQQYTQEIQQLLQQLNATLELTNDAKVQLSYADGLMKANKLLLTRGDVRIADYVIAINTYLNARNVITQSIINRYQLINQINYWNSNK